MPSLTLELILPTWKKKKWQKGLRLPQLGLPVIAALTPPDVKVIVTEEEIEEVTYKSNVDLVGISYMTPMARRAYEIADEYRSRGVKVVLGGIHASSLPEEAEEHADAVVIGEAEKVWGELIEDFKKDRLKRFYKSATFPDLKNMPIPRRELIKQRKSFSPYSIQTTRGCPFDCHFCSVTRFFGGTFRSRPIEDVIREIKISQRKNWIFIDDNIIGNQLYAQKLFRELIPLEIKWVGQSSLLLTRNDELLKLAVESGCSGLFIGFESLNAENLKDSNKGFNKVEEYEECIRKFHDQGIIILASFIFGFDHDDKYVFEKTVKFLKKNKVAAVSMPVLTPFPGTKLYKKLESEGRILTRDWSKYDYETAVFKPKLMRPEELEQGAGWAYSDFHSTSSIISRFTSNWRHPLLYCAVNMGFKAKHRKYIETHNVTAR